MVNLYLIVAIYVVSFIVFYKMSITYNLTLFSSIIFYIIYFPIFIFIIIFLNFINILIYIKTSRYSKDLLFKIIEFKYFMFYKYYEITLLKYFRKHNVAYTMKYLSGDEVILLNNIKEYIDDYDAFGQAVKEGNTIKYAKNIIETKIKKEVMDK